MSSKQSLFGCATSLIAFGSKVKSFVKNVSRFDRLTKELDFLLNSVDEFLDLFNLDSSLDESQLLKYVKLVRLTLSTAKVYHDFV